MHGRRSLLLKFIYYAELEQIYFRSATRSGCEKSTFPIPVTRLYYLCIHLQMLPEGSISLLEITTLMEKGKYAANVTQQRKKHNYLGKLEFCAR